MKRIVTDACENSMKRDKGENIVRNKMYWWSAEIAELREKCGMWRRRLTRTKSRSNIDRVTQLAGELKEKRKELKRAIGKAKRDAWSELLEGLSGDPWGRPYKAVMNKIKTENSNIIKKLAAGATKKILEELFPKDRG